MKGYSGMMIITGQVVISNLGTRRIICCSQKWVVPRGQRFARIISFRNLNFVKNIYTLSMEL